MPGNCLLIISKNEGKNPLSIANLAINSGVIDKVIISDGSNEEIFKSLKKRETNNIQVISEKKYVNTSEIGKGIGMISGGFEAIEQDFDRIGFIDGDILNPDMGDWFEFLFNPLEGNVDVVKAAFLRNPADGQITRHITKPLTAMFYPNAWEIDQPLGGELALKREVLEDIYTKGISPPFGWGIDTFITLKSLMFGYRMGEVYLGQKLHGKKTLSNLRGMFDQCFVEAVRMIHYFYSLPIRKKIKPIVGVSSSYKINKDINETYMDIKKEVTRSLPSFKFMKKMHIPHDDLFLKIKSIDDFSSFYELTESFDFNYWIEMLYWYVKKYDPSLIDQYYLRWKIRSLSFCLHEIKSVEQAENRTILQAKTAANFLYRIGNQAVIENRTKKLFF